MNSRGIRLWGPSRHSRYSKRNFRRGQNILPFTHRGNRCGHGVFPPNVGTGWSCRGLNPFSEARGCKSREHTDVAQGLPPIGERRRHYSRSEPRPVRLGPRIGEKQVCNAHAEPRGMDSKGAHNMPFFVGLRRRTAWRFLEVTAPPCLP
ncbi:hypothetical protein DQ04_00201110 [Trypanosoma grayi]|uniref:hypothetical protein n=1 Tax=Trypanosoma grayi TaxID=71804 RepID=UPI0004F470FE|nr:hypothetical protein DQ04_00201110 [Trypanosoma grayi]KEG15058.1 hypothetical protein DQ04_00201110 [Trypanosoma grayi]